MTAQEIVSLLVKCFENGNKVLICGNGGSAAQSQHMAAELMGRFELDRPPLPAIALSTDTSFLTAWSNDVSFGEIFQRQIQALGKPGDVLIVFSTSGKSRNCLLAIAQAKTQDLEIVDWPRGEKTTAHTQEKQLSQMHNVVRAVEKKMFGGN